MKAPRTKLQTPGNLQIPSPQGPKAARLSQVLELEAWDFPGAWCLGFGASSNRMKAPRTKPQTPKKLQIPSPKGPKTARLSQVLEFEAWDLVLRQPE